MDGARPARACAVNRGAVGGGLVPSGGWYGVYQWQATAVAGEEGIDYVASDSNGVTSRHTLPSGGPVAQVLAWFSTGLLVLADGLELWNLDPRAGGSYQDPVFVGRGELFGEDPVAAACRARLGEDLVLLLLADAPGRLAVVSLVPWGRLLADSVPLPSLEGTILAVAAAPSVGSEPLLWVLTDAGPAGRVYLYDVQTPTAPQLVAQRDLGPGAAPVAASVWNDEDGEPYVLAVRRSWGVEVYDRTLALRGAVRLPGEAQAVAGNLVALGDFGVAVLTGLPSAPVATVVDSNTQAPGRSVAFADADDVGHHYVVTPDGVTAFSTRIDEGCGWGGGGSAGAREAVPGAPFPGPRRRPAGALAAPVRGGARP